MTNFYDDISRISGSGSSGFGPDNQPGRPLSQPPPAPSTTAYMNPSQMSDYLHGPLSDWVNENRASFPPSTYSQINIHISEAASYLSSTSATSQDSIDTYNSILSALGVVPSDEEKANQMDAVAQNIDKQSQGKLGSLEAKVSAVTAQLESYQEQLQSLQSSAGPSTVLQEASDALQRAQSTMSTLRDTLSPLQEAAGNISDAASQISEIASQLHGFTSPSSMQSLQSQFNQVINSQASFQVAYSAASTTAATQLIKVQNIINENIKPIVEPSSSYDWEDYNNNWGGGPVPGGVNGDLAFAVVNADGSFNGQYPLGGTGDNGFAVGGWTDSQSGGGLNAVLTQALINGNLTPAQQTLLNNILGAVEKYGYSRVVMDFEDYGDANAGQTSASYTLFLQQLGAKLHSMDPPVKLEMAISPDVTNQNYYNMNTLLSSGAVDAFQVMCYDYEQGNPGTTGVASVAQTQAYLQQMFAQYPGLTQSKLMIGFPLYGAQYNLPAGLTPAQVLAALAQQTTPAAGEVGDNTILSEIGNWTSPTGDWEKISDGKTPPTYFYYNSETGKLYNTFPPDSMQDFANMIKTQFPGVQGFFGWEASDDLPGGSLFQTMMSYIQSTPPPVSQAVSEVETWLQNLKDVPSTWTESLISQLKSNPPQTLEQLAAWFSTNFGMSGNKDIYMQYPGLVQQIGGSGGRLDNQLNDLFTSNPNLVSLLGMGATIPAVTAADSLYINLQGWNPDPKTDPSGAQAKIDILKQLSNFGSEWSQADIKQYYWYPIQPTLNAQDAAFLAQIMYANT